MVAIKESFVGGSKGNPDFLATTDRENNATTLFFQQQTAVLTVAIGCVIVAIMKGPAYAADSFPVEHSDRPRPDKPPQ